MSQECLIEKEFFESFGVDQFQNTKANETLDMFCLPYFFGGGNLNLVSREFFQADDLIPKMELISSADVNIGLTSKTVNLDLSNEV